MYYLIFNLCCVSSDLEDIIWLHSCNFFVTKSNFKSAKFNRFTTTLFLHTPSFKNLDFEADLGLRLFIWLKEKETSSESLDGVISLCLVELSHEKNVRRPTGPEHVYVNIMIYEVHIIWEASMGRRQLFYFFSHSVELRFFLTLHSVKKGEVAFNGQAMTS